MRSSRTLRLRLLAAFVGVAAVAIAAFAVLTLSAGRSDVQQLVHRQQQTTSTNVAAAVADGYRAAGSWPLADLRAARAIAVSGEALIEVRNSAGQLVLQAGRGFGPGAPARLHGAPRLATAYGQPRVLPILVDGTTVGSVSVRFPKDALPPAERQLRDALTRTTVYGILIAVAVALAVGFVVADGITRPLRRLIEAVQRLGRGDRGARANLTAPGELGELAAAVDRMAAALEREDELRRALTADVAHELRTPVTIVTAQCEAMLDGVTPITAEQLTSLHDETLRVGRVIQDLETLASAEAAGLRLERAPVDLAELTAEETRRLSPQFGEAKIELATELEPATVDGDAFRLGQIVRNLLTNALKFTPEGGHVLVRLGQENGGIALSVSDTGIGISPADMPHVFDRFWRGANGRSAAGSGIGLAVVDELVRAHNGSVSVASDASGTVFTVRLPREA